MLKSDNETAILALLIESLKELRVNGLQQVLSADSPEYDPQANGPAEIAVKARKGMFRIQVFSRVEYCDESSCAASLYRVACEIGG